MELKAKYVPLYFFCYVKLVDFLPVNEVGPPLARFLSVQGKVWHSQKGLSHKKRYPFCRAINPR